MGGQSALQKRTPQNRPDDSRYRRGTPIFDLPVGWDRGLKAAKAAGQLTCWHQGDSITAGQSLAPYTDALAYGWVGRLDALMAGKYGGMGEGYAIASANPGGITSPNNPYAVTGTYSKLDGGVGEVWRVNDTATWDFTLTIPNHPVTGAAPTSVDLFTLDYNTGLSWQYQVGSAAAVTVNTTGGNGATGNSVLRRTTIAIPSGATTIKVGQASAANALAVVGHAVTYGTTGWAPFRNGIQGWRAVDFTSGAGSNAGIVSGTTGRASFTPDHIKPLSGVQDAYNNAGSAWPFAPAVATIALGTNDCSFGAKLEQYEIAVLRMIRAFRRGNPNCTIILIANAYPDVYTDVQNLARPYRWHAYKRALRRLGQQWGCAFMDVDLLFGPTPAASGYLPSSDVHPSQNGNGAGGGDGHLLIAQTLFSLIG